LLKPPANAPSEAAVDGADLVGERLLEREHVLAVDRDRLASAELDDLYLLAVVCEVDVTLALDAHNRRSLAGGGLLEEARNSSLCRGPSGERNVARVRDHRSGLRHHGAVDVDVQGVAVLALKRLVARCRCVLGGELIEIHMRGPNP